MKLALAAALTLLIASGASRAPAALAGEDKDAELVYVRPGATEHVRVAFAIGGTTSSDPKVASLAVRARDRIVDVTGVAEGKTRVRVTEAGHADHAHLIYVIVTTHVQVKQ